MYAVTRQSNLYDDGDLSVEIARQWDFISPGALVDRGVRDMSILAAMDEKARAERNRDVSRSRRTPCPAVVFSPASPQNAGNRPQTRDGRLFTPAPAQIPGQLDMGL